MSRSYTVGYKKPPRETRFKKGQSGNPRGRPRRIPTTDAVLLTEVLNETVTVVENGRRLRIPLRMQIERRLTETALTGDLAAGRALERYLVFTENFQFAGPTIFVRSKRF